ncbi:MAG: branched-chain amino acid ABC transporter permease [Actinomycetes bacterium]
MRRWTKVSATSMAVVVVTLGLLGIVPMTLNDNAVQQLTSLLIFVILAGMWNALAGYGGMVSVGQQGFIGLGAYGTILLTRHGVPPYLAMVLAAIAAAALALPISVLVLRLRGGQFAIGTWVVAATLGLLVALDGDLGGGTGVSLTGLNVYEPTARTGYTYWLTLGFAVVVLGLSLLLLRSRHGAALQAIRDDEEAAASVGVRVLPLKLLLFVLAAFGCGAAGAMILANTLFIQPQSIFGVQWTAYMIFMVLVGGLGTFEGPILGAVIFFGLQYEFADRGAWYLIGLGVTAIAFALLLPRGLWSLVEDRLNVQLLPVGYRLAQGQQSRERRRPWRSR